MATILKIILAVLVVTIVSMTAFSSIDKGQSPTVVGENQELIDDSETIKVEISGEVNNEGIYYVEVGATLYDLIDSANGLTKNADELCFNTSVSLVSNGEYYIAPLYELSDVCGNSKIVKYNVNKCNAEDLTEINGIGKTVASSIVSYREEHGNFMQLEEVMNVNGVGNATFSKLKNFIRLKDSVA